MLRWTSLGARVAAPALAAIALAAIGPRHPAHAEPPDDAAPGLQRTSTGPGPAAGPLDLGDRAAPPLRRATALRQDGAPLPERLERLSAAFEGVPYVDSPLGEGAGVDPDPLLRWDAVDCLTYVEQVLALAQAPSPDRLLPVLNDLRYADGQPDFGRRNHLMMAQWVPRNLAKGWLVDVAPAVGGARARRAEKVITADSWRLRKGTPVELPPEQVPVGTSALSIIPVDRILEVADRIPEGTVLLVVREDLWTRPYRVTHLGFVFHRRGTAWLRHAARAGYGRVVDERLDTFVARNAAYRRWRVEGFALLQPVDNPARAAALGRNVAARDVADADPGEDPATATRPDPSAGSRGG